MEKYRVLKHISFTPHDSKGRTVTEYCREFYPGDEFNYPDDVQVPEGMTLHIESLLNKEAVEKIG